MNSQYHYVHEPGKSSHRKILDEFFLAILLLLVTSFDYIWYGPMPMWLYFAVIGFILSIFSHNFRINLIAVVSKMFLPVILPWLIYVTVVLILETSQNILDDSFSKSFLLNMATLFLMIVLATWSSLVKPTILIYIVALIALMQGLLCIAQYLGVTEAWTLPDTIYSFFGQKKTLDEIGAFQEIQRVRGTNLYIHKFNVMQGMLVAYLVTAFAVNLKNDTISSGTKFILLPATAIGFLGMFLTFSRSTIVGLLLTALLIIISQRRIKSLLLLILLAGLSLFVFSELNVSKSKEIGRITDFSKSRTTNASRLSHLKHSLEVITESPIVGDSSQHSTSNILIHSVALRILVNYGFLGFLPYLGVLIGICYLFVVGIKKGKGLALAGLCALLVSVIDAWTHSSGMLVKDVSQPGLIGAFVGIVMGNSRGTLRIGEKE